MNDVKNEDGEKEEEEEMKGKVEVEVAPPIESPPVVRKRRVGRSGGDVVGTPRTPPTKSLPLNCRPGTGKRKRSKSGTLETTSGTASSLASTVAVVEQESATATTTPHKALSAAGSATGGKKRKLSPIRVSIPTPPALSSPGVSTTVLHNFSSAFKSASS